MKRLQADAHFAPVTHAETIGYGQFPWNQTVTDAEPQVYSYETVTETPERRGEGVGAPGIPKTGNRLARTVLTDLEHRQKRLLGNIHLADALHPLLALFLLLEQLAFT